MRKFAITIVALCFSALAFSQKVTQVRYAGPFSVKNPVMIDEKDVSAKQFDESNLLDIPIRQTLLENGQMIDIKFLPSGGDSKEAALHMIGFNVENKLYTGITIEVKGIRKYQLFVDGKKQMSGYIRLEPTTHQVVVKYLTVPTDSQKGENEEEKQEVAINIESDSSPSGETEGSVRISDYSARHKYNFMDVITASTYTGAALSPNGKYIRISYRTTANDGKTKTHTLIRETATGRQIADLGYSVFWMPTSNKYYYTEDTPAGMKFYCVDPATGIETTLAEGVPRGSYNIAPTEDYLILYKESEGPKEDEGVYQVLEPEDRQPGWRNRTNLLRYDIKSGMVQPLQTLTLRDRTFTSHRASHHCRFSLSAQSGDDGNEMCLRERWLRITCHPLSRWVDDSHLRQSGSFWRHRKECSRRTHAQHDRQPAVPH